jgi:hypothetical protein
VTHDDESHGGSIKRWQYQATVESSSVSPSERAPSKNINARVHQPTCLSRKKWIEFPCNSSSIVFHARDNKVYRKIPRTVNKRNDQAHKIRPFDLSALRESEAKLRGQQREGFLRRKKIFTDSNVDIGSQLNCCLLSTLLNKGGQSLTRH